MSWHLICSVAHYFGLSVHMFYAKRKFYFFTSSLNNFVCTLLQNTCKILLLGLTTLISVHMTLKPIRMIFFNCSLTAIWLHESKLSSSIALTICHGVCCEMNHLALFEMQMNLAKDLFGRWGNYTGGVLKGFLLLGFIQVFY